MSELLALGVSHKTAPLDLRERLSLTEGRAVGALHELTAGVARLVREITHVRSVRELRGDLHRLVHGRASLRSQRGRANAPEYHDTDEFA